ncbi:MAG: UV damage repair endonuclease [uncultured Thermomicrobiales bacterium]|uniref:UV damage repair endonuclease n=1 Tax=uncultured Thermomicrobiales bacterium TaxID=1645740 RepID=A0A6J4UTP8_9BACT|nr:MAG: UV damage repair endonuclease [uncultured Thermomicrobiales bacterium]
MSGIGTATGAVPRPDDAARVAAVPPDADCLGFAVKVLGWDGLKANDARRWQSGPHLRVSLGYLDAILDYLAETGIRMYRMSSDIAPYATHPDLPQFHAQLDECADELAAFGARARALDIRLSLHPSQYIVLNSPVERVAAASLRDFDVQATLLDRMGMGPECRVVTHVGGVYGDRAAAADRFVTRYETLPEATRARLVLENDETSWPVADVLEIHARCGIPVVFDILHHRVNDPDGIDPAEACLRCLATWSTGQRPKIHYSSQRLADRTVIRRVAATGEKSERLAPPKAGQHDDWIDPVDFVAFRTATGDARYDVMLEAKQKDLAVLRLREAIMSSDIPRPIW